jgi:glutathione S-transferase
MPRVTLETALTAPGLSVLVAAGVPSPWSQAALAILHYKRVPFLRVQTRVSDPAFQRWNRAFNLPAVLCDAEPVRTGWANILALSERLAPARPLSPANPAERVRMLGLCHECMGEGALVWCARLLAIESGIASQGREGFPLQIARYLAPRYGFGTVPVNELRSRAVSLLSHLEAERARAVGPYFMGETISAIDFYSAVTMNALVPLPEVMCPMAPEIRKAFEWMGAQLSGSIPRGLLAHRDDMISRHFELPMEL